MPHLIGLISDTHGLLRPEAAAALHGVELILHAGDVGSRDVLIELGLVAPVLAVYGNVDDPFTPELEEQRYLEVGGWRLLVTHGHLVPRLSPDTMLRRFDARVIVYGHTHRALVHRAGGRLVVNPGAAGPRRFDIVPSVARLTLAADDAHVEIIPLG
jgi:putative phosphoesterase